MTQPARPCDGEQHRHNSRLMFRDGGLTISCCRYCGCTLIRAGAMRKWYRSGMMG